MGTRGAYGFRVDGADKVTYNHFDSYPTALGRTMVNYVRGHTADELAAVARRLELVDGEQPAPGELQARYRKFADLGVSRQTTEEWYTLLRNAQGEPDAWHRTKSPVEHMIDGADFLADSLFCEFAYIVNIDTGKLEAYKGFNKDPKAVGRYAHLQDKPAHRSTHEYFGVRLLEEVPFETIRTMATGDVKALVNRWERYGEEEGE